ncbi:hypothetical protein PybrP1_012316 [[Pythium] brassicae (nom. inval.)]|nr:hypothetical protein PybrP1_012316 [[Pythium] brassicae (nom. inval.)]
MDTDLFANLTALSPPPPSTARRLVAARSRATMTTAISAITTTTASLQDDDDDDALGACESVSSSGMQWSADPSAFTGGARGRFQQQQQSPLRMRLALDLRSRARQQHAFLPERVSVSQLSQNTSYSQQQFAELFFADSQGEDADSILNTTSSSTNSATGADARTPATFVARGNQNGDSTRRSVPSTVRFTVESARAQSNDDESIVDDADGGTRTPSPTPQLAAGRDSEDDDRDSDGDGDVTVHPAFQSPKRTGIGSSSLSMTTLIDEHGQESNANAAAHDEQETEPFGDDASDDDRGADFQHRRDSMDSFPDTQTLSDVDSEDGGDNTIANANTEPMTDDGTEPMDGETEDATMGSVGGGTEPADDDENDVPPTQRSFPTQTSARTLSPVHDSQGKVAPSPGRAALRRRGKSSSGRLPPPSLSDSEPNDFEFEGPLCSCGHAACSCEGHDDDGGEDAGEAASASTKVSSASRNLAFSFALPDSQENSSQSLGSAPDASLQAKQASSAIRASDMDAATTAAVARPPQARANKRGGGIPRAPTATATESSEVDQSSDSVLTGTSSVESTPTRRTRKRHAPSPDVGMAEAPTPAKCAAARRSQRAAVAPAATRTGSTTPGRHSAPNFRTRSSPLTPIAPPSRTVSARSKDMFRYKFDFCVTGFASDTQAKVVKLIEEHGGKVWEKEVLHPSNSAKAVVIATAIAWRKLKFRYAVACGIPVVHPEWLRACVKAGEPVPFSGYFVPSGYSIVKRKFEYLPVRRLDVFAGLSFGIPYDAEHSSKTSTKALGDLIAFLLQSCGAKFVVEGLTPSKEKEVDIVLSDEVTRTCRLYSMRHKVPVKNFSWVTECIVLQRLVQLDDKLFEPYSHDNEHQSLLAATAYIGGVERTQVKLYTGELVLVDLPRKQIENFLIFDVCEILRITRVGDAADGDAEADEVMLEVGVVKRTPNSPMLARVHTDILKIPASKVLRRVVAISRADFNAIAYKDETMFYYDEDEDEDEEVDGGGSQ